MVGVASGSLGRLPLMTRTALARKYRPTRFSGLVAQEHVAAGLTGAVAKDRVAHAYLLTGPRGVGKTSAARILAMSLNCERRGTDAAPPGEPCGACDSCHRIWSGAANLDVVEIDAASNRGVDDARDLRERAMYAASGAERYKAYIIDEAHMLTREAWNALLKILEEPPARVVFVFATTEPQKIANTAAPVLSRVQRFDFRRIGPQAITERLQYVAKAENIVLEDDAAQLIARVASGALRDALSLLDQTLAFGEGAVTATRVRDALGLIDDEVYAELLDIVVEGRTADVFPFVARLVEAGADLIEFTNGAGEALRALLLHIVGAQAEGASEVLRSAVRRNAERCGEGDVLRMLRLFGETEVLIRRSPNVRLHVETLLVQWSLLDRTVEIQAVLDALGVTRRDAPAEPVSRVPRPKQTAGASRAPRAAAPAPPTPGDPPSVTGLEAVWPAVLEAVGQKRRMVREALAHARPVAVTAHGVTLEVTQSDVHLQGLQQSTALIGTAIQRVTGWRLRVECRPDEQGETPTSQAEPQRLSRTGDQEERVKSWRAKDPALDTVADALDLELLE